MKMQNKALSILLVLVVVGGIYFGSSKDRPCYSLLLLVIIIGVYFVVTKNNISNESGFNNSNNTEEIPQPPQLPE